MRNDYGHVIHVDGFWFITNTPASATCAALRQWWCRSP